MLFGSLSDSALPWTEKYASTLRHLWECLKYHVTGEFENVAAGVFTRRKHHEDGHSLYREPLPIMAEAPSQIFTRVSGG